VTAQLSKNFWGLLNGGFPSPGKKQQQTQNTGNTPTKPSTSGARVYLPSGSEVIFVLGQTQNQQLANQEARPGLGTNTTGQQAITSPGQITPDARTQATAAPAGGSTATAAPAQGNNSVLYENILYQLQGCQRQSPHIVCNLQITNQRAVDAFLRGGQASYYVDQAGNKAGTSMRKIANCIGFGNCQLLPGVAMAASFEFVDEEGHATNLVRLAIAESGKYVAQFNNVPIQ
jgi:hypothetical protein